MTKEGIHLGVYAKKPTEWVVCLRENSHHPPLIKESVLHLGVGVSIVISARSTKMVKFPYTFNKTGEYKDLGNLPRGV